MDHDTHMIRVVEGRRAARTSYRRSATSAKQAAI
jgi:hypothetical protein